MARKFYVIHHGADADGWGSAHIAYNFYAEHGLLEFVTFIPINYGDPLPVMDDDSFVRILDFSFDRATIEALCARMHEVVVCDHHKTTIEDLQDLWVSGSDRPGNLVLNLDSAKAGVVLTWEFYRKLDPVPEFYQYIQDRDLWLFGLPRSKEFSMGLYLHAYDFEEWNTLDVDSLIAQGVVALRLQDIIVEKAVKTAKLTDIGGYAVPCVNATTAHSEIGHALCKAFPDAPFSASFFVRPDGMVKWSLRSEGAFDVSEVAKQFKGGGGHRNAAGFEVHLDGLEGLKPLPPVAYRAGW